MVRRRQWGRRGRCGCTCRRKVAPRGLCHEAQQRPGTLSNRAPGSQGPVRASSPGLCFPLASHTVTAAWRPHFPGVPLGSSLVLYDRHLARPLMENHLIPNSSHFPHPESPFLSLPRPPLWQPASLLIPSVNFLFLFL